MKFAMWQHQLDARPLVIGRVHLNAAPGATSAIYDFHTNSRLKQLTID